jgi:uncharacterized OsmC-like protein
MSQAELIEPTVDPETKNLVYRNLVARNAGGSRTEISVRDTQMVTDEPTSRGGTNGGPTPVETVMGGLCGCDAVITGMVAELLDFEYGDIEYLCDAEIYFEKVTLQKTIKTNEPEDRIEKLKKNVEQRCPVSNLIRDAGVDLHIEWIVVPL